jgi:hypothetical protein
MAQPIFVARYTPSMKWLAHASMWLMAAGLTAQEPDPGQSEQEPPVEQSGEQIEGDPSKNQGEADEAAKPFKQEFAPIIPM